MTGFLARRAKLLAVVLLMAASGLVLLGTTQTWLNVSIAEAQGVFPVSGSDAPPMAQPLALAVLALSLVLTLVGRVLRYVLGALATAAGVGLVAAILPIVTGPPVYAYAVSVTEHTGLAGDEAIADIVSSIDQTAWPLVCLVASVVVVLAGAFVLATAHLWRAGGRRFDTTPHAPAAGPIDPIDSWDDLSHGEDPTR